MPFLIVIMGVSGSGKSVLAEAIAGRCGLRCLDADDFHSSEARGLMSRGIALDDELRAPWIDSIRRHLIQLSTSGEDAVLAFSGLKKRYREALRDAGFRTLFLFLDCDAALIRRRMAERRGHFMPPALLDDQFETLERPVDEADVVRLDSSAPLPQVRDRALALLASKGVNCNGC